MHRIKILFLSVQIFLLGKWVYHCTPSIFWPLLHFWCGGLLFSRLIDWAYWRSFPPNWAAGVISMIAALWVTALDMEGYTNGKVWEIDYALSNHSSWFPADRFIFGFFAIWSHSHMRDFPDIGCSGLDWIDLELILSPHLITEMRVTEVQVICFASIFDHFRRRGLRWVCGK